MHGLAAELLVMRPDCVEDTHLIEDSEPWRLDLKRFATSINAARFNPLRTDQALARLERDHMYGFFAIRRLMECFKLSTHVCECLVSVVQYRYRSDTHLTMMNWSQLDRHYHLDRGVQSSLPLRDLCNQVIHSYVFSLAVGAGHRLVGLFVSSEYRRRRSLAYVPAWRTCRLFRRVASDFPNRGSAIFDATAGDFVWKLETR